MLSYDFKFLHFLPVIHLFILKRRQKAPVFLWLIGVVSFFQNILKEWTVRKRKNVSGERKVLDFLPAVHSFPGACDQHHWEICSNQNDEANDT